MLLAKGPHPPRFEVEPSGDAFETAAQPGISSRSSTTSKPDRLVQPRMSRAAISFLHMRTIISAIQGLVKAARERRLVKGDAAMDAQIASP